MAKNPEQVSYGEKNTYSQGKGADAKVNTRMFGKRSNPTNRGGVNRPTKGR